MRRGAIVRAGFFLVLTLALLATEVAGAAEGADFRLDLDAGGHTARITDLAFAPDGETIVSASDDTLSSIDMDRIDDLNVTGYRIIKPGQLPWAPEWD